MKYELPLVIAGPCAVESKKQILDIAKKLKENGIYFLRGGAYKPRTSPSSFQGLGLKGLKYLYLTKKKTGMKIVTEVTSPEKIRSVSKVADILQVGARNMDNYDLLKRIGQLAPKKTVLLKRGMQSTKKELIGAIGYLRKNGHKAEIIVCERGIRTFANGEYARFTLDVSMIADLKKDKKFKHRVIVDPSHPAGRADIVENLAYAGIAAGADGLIVEIKLDNKSVPLSDAKQAITIKEFFEILPKIKKIYNLVNQKKEKYKIIKGIFEPLRKVPFHKDMPFLKRVVLINKNLSPYNQKIVAHYINIPKGEKVPGYVDEHVHDFDEINILVSNSKEDFIAEIGLDGKKHMIKAPASVYIPSGTRHMIRVLKGEGIFIALLTS